MSHDATPRRGALAGLSLDAHAYFRLPLHVRDQLNAWLAQEGISREHLFRLDLGEGCVVLHVYAVNNQGRRYIANPWPPSDRRVAASHRLRLPVRSLPPIEAF